MTDEIKQINRKDLKGNKYGIKHGLTSGKVSRFYNIWRGIQIRCYNPNDPGYKYYGARGIKCEWKNIKEFKRDMHDSYLSHCRRHGVKNTSIDRADNDGHYCIENCRWASWKIQNNNSRNCRMIKFDGIEKNVSEWAYSLGMKVPTLYNRIFIRHWSIEKALTTKVDKNYARY